MWQQTPIFKWADLISNMQFVICRNAFKWIKNLLKVNKIQSFQHPKHMLNAIVLINLSIFNVIKYNLLIIYALIKNPTFCTHKMKELKTYPFWFFGKLMFAYNISKV
jgi:hypothetical protein